MPAKDGRTWGVATLPLSLFPSHSDGRNYYRLLNVTSQTIKIGTTLWKLLSARARPERWFMGTFVSLRNDHAKIGGDSGVKLIEEKGSLCRRIATRGSGERTLPIAWNADSVFYCGRCWLCNSTLDGAFNSEAILVSRPVPFVRRSFQVVRCTFLWNQERLKWQ